MKSLRIQNYLVVIAAFTTSCVGAGEAHAQSSRFKVEMTNGSTITVDVETEAIKWTNVNPDGQLSNQQISLNSVQRLVVTDQPASEQVANIRRLISELGSKNYHEREAAEQQLSDKKTGLPYQSLIERHADDEVFEVRYRIGRILRELKAAGTSRSTSAATFDRLILNSGEVLEGDAGGFRLDCNYSGRQLTLLRNQIVRLNPPDPIQTARLDTSPTSVALFHDYADFKNDALAVIDFEKSPDGEELVKSTNVSDTFTDVGLKLDMEGNGFIGISGYPFDFEPLPPKANSVCVFETSGAFPKRFRGVFEITFCVPKHPAVPAGVREFGLFLARVGHSRDLIMEAYNADGHLLATVEATEDPCMFGGVKSNELIAKVRLLSSPHLFRVDRKIDEDYAVDNIMFSNPQPLPYTFDGNQDMLRMKNGDQFAIENLDFSMDKVSFNSKQLNAEFEVNQAEVAEIRFANPPERESDQWLAMLPDRSIVRVNSPKKRQAIDFDNAELTDENVLALAEVESVFRYAESQDYDEAATILVFPTCRILPDELEIRDKSIVWNKGARKLEQPLVTIGNQSNEDPTPPTNSIRFSEPTPTIWFGKPVSPDSEFGLLQLTDGQQFIIGGSAGFEVFDFNKQGVTVSWNNSRATIPWNRVRMIKFPNTEK